MAENVFVGPNPPLRGIYRFLQRNVLDCLSQTDNPAIMSSISKFFNEVEAAVGLLEEKYHDQSRNREVQQPVGTQSMVINALKKIHEKIVRRLRTTSSMATPWKGEFTLDLPREVFPVILNHIIQRNSYGHRYKESDAVIDVELTQLRKAVFIFDKMNLEGDLIAKAELLKKNFSSGKEAAAERCEVVITESKPMRLKYRKNSDAAFSLPPKLKVFKKLQSFLALVWWPIYAMHKYFFPVHNIHLFSAQM